MSDAPVARLLLLAAALSSGLAVLLTLDGHPLNQTAPAWLIGLACLVVFRVLDAWQ
jgi:hypothetical protein